MEDPQKQPNDAREGEGYGLQSILEILENMWTPWKVPTKRAILRTLTAKTGEERRMVTIPSITGKGMDILGKMRGKGGAKNIVTCVK